MSKPTERELELVKEVRGRIHDLDVEEEYLETKNLVRFVRARNGNVHDAEHMIRKNVEWMDEQDIANILRWVPPLPNRKKDWPWSFVGFDDFGGPVVVVPLGRWNGHAVSGRRDDVVRMSLQYFEEVWKVMRFNSIGKDFIPQFTVLVDLEGLGWKHLSQYDAIQGILTIVKYFEANYPDTLKCGVIVNAPSIFGMFWKLVKHLVSEATHAKLVFLGSDKRLWKEAYHHRSIKEDQVPEYYGGTLPDSYELSVEGGVCKYICQNGNECTYGL